MLFIESLRDTWYTRVTDFTMFHYVVSTEETNLNEMSPKSLDYAIMFLLKITDTVLYNGTTSVGCGRNNSIFQP